MNKLTLFGVLLLFLAGCYLGDRVTPPRTVSLTFPTPAGQNKVSLSVSDAQVQDALQFIDKILTSDGLTRDPNPSGNEPGHVASYARYNGTGPRPVGGPEVFFKDDRLEISIFELGNHSGHYGTATKRICNLLQKELSNRYGADRVKVE